MDAKTTLEKHLYACDNLLSAMLNNDSIAYMPKGKAFEVIFNLECRIVETTEFMKSIDGGDSSLPVKIHDDVFIEVSQALGAIFLLTTESNSESLPDSVLLGVIQNIKERIDAALFHFESDNTIAA